jgi:hypothetical protein
MLLEGCDVLQHIVVQHHHGYEPTLGQDTDPPQHRVENQLQVGVLLPVDAGGHQRSGQQRQPLMGVCLHQHSNLPLALPSVGAEGGDVHGRTLCSMLELVAIEVRQLLVHWAQHVEPPK